MVVPVKVTIDQYLTLILDSMALKVNEEDSGPPSLEIPGGSLYLGQINSNIYFNIGKKEKEKEKRNRSGLKDKKEEQKNDEEMMYGTNYETQTRVKIVNNSRPFVLKIRMEYGADEKFILDLKTKEKNPENKKCALYIKVSSIQDKTCHPEFLIKPGQWISYPEDAEDLAIYDSGDEIAGDEFMVTFAIFNPDPDNIAGKYGGIILWNLLPSI